MAVDCDAKIAGHALDIRPAHVGIGAEFLAFNEGDVAMPQMKEVLEGHLGGAAVIQHDVGDAIDIVVSGDGNDGHRKVEVPRSVDGDEAINRALEEHSGIFVDEIGAVAMAGDEVKVAFLEEVVLNATHNRGRVTIADLGNNDSDSEAALGAERTGEEVGAVLELSGGGEDAVFGLLRDGIGNIGAVDNQ